jgi:hypothetical protein
MSTLSQFGGGAGRVTALHSSFTWNATTNIQRYFPHLAANSGACSAGVLKTILSVTGSKVRLNFFQLTNNDATARNNRVRITIDGTVVFDATVANSSGSHHIAVGQIIGGTTSSAIFHPVDANNSLLIEYSSSVTETDKASFAYAYEVRQ